MPHNYIISSDDYTRFSDICLKSMCDNLVMFNVGKEVRKKLGLGSEQRGENLLTNLGLIQQNTLVLKIMRCRSSCSMFSVFQCN